MNVFFKQILYEQGSPIVTVNIISLRKHNFHTQNAISLSKSVSVYEL